MRTEVAAEPLIALPCGNTYDVASQSRCSELAEVDEAWYKCCPCPLLAVGMARRHHFPCLRIPRNKRPWRLLLRPRMCGPHPPRGPSLDPHCHCAGMLWRSGLLPPLDTPWGTHTPYSLTSSQHLIPGLQKRRLGPGLGHDLPRVTYRAQLWARRPWSHRLSQNCAGLNAEPPGASHLCSHSV